MLMGENPDLIEKVCNENIAQQIYYKTCGLNA